MARAQILVAAGDSGFARGLAANLESLGYAVTEVVSSPAEAVKKAQEKQPDLVLLDLEWLRDGKNKTSRELRKRIPNLVYLVGEEDPQTLERAQITHSFDYLRKAYDLRELETIIDVALHRRQWQQREEKQAAKIGKITAKLENETHRHQRLEEVFQAERQKLYAVLDTLPAYVVLLAPDYSVPFANREFISRFGAPAGRKCYEFLFGRTSPCPDCETYKALQTNAPHEWQWTGPDGRDYQIYDFPFPDLDGSTLILEMGVDVTDLKEKETEIKRANRALRTLSAANQAVVRAQTEAELLQDVCRTVIKEGGYRLAWIGYGEDDPGKTVRPMTQAGYEEGYLKTLKITWADTKRGRGPTGTAIRTGRPVLSRNILTDPHFAPWREEALKRGYGSSISLPLLVNGTVFGVFNIYAGEADAFDNEEVQLLSDLAADVSYGVMVLRAREERRHMAAALRRSYEEMEARVQDRTQELAQSNAALQNEIAERLWSEKKLRESEERYRHLVDLSPDAIAVQSQGRYLFINPAGAELFGAADPRDMVGKAVADTIHPDYRQLVSEHICRVDIEGVKTELQEIKILRPDGRVVDAEATGVGITYQGQPAALVMLREITARKEMEQSLEHQASFPRLNPNPVLEADTAGNITYANAASLRALEKLDLENQVTAFLPPDLDEIMRARAETGETVFSREVEIGDAVFAASISFPGEFPGIRIYARDITEQKRAEIERQEVLEKLQASEEELQVINEELQVQAEELQAQAEELQVQTEELRAANQNLNETHTALLGSNQRLALLAETTGRLLAEKSPQEVVESMCRKVMEVLQCDVCFNFLLEEKVGRLHLNACVGIPEEEAREIEWLDYGVAVCGCAARDGCRIVAEDIQTTPDPRTELVKSYGVQAYACHPLRVQGRTLGTLSFGARHRSRFTPDELELMLAVADQVAIAMDRKQAEEALRESEARFKAVFEGAAIGIALKGVEGRYFQANDAFLEMLGYTQDELLHKTYMDLTHPEDAPQDREAYQELISSRRGHCLLEKRYLRKDGDILWGQNSVSLVRDDLGEPRFFVSMVEDITSRKAAEEALRESREDLNRAQAVAHIGSWRLDVRRNELTWSDENHRIFGIPPGTPMTYETFLAAVHPEDREHVDREWTAALRGEPYDIEHRIVVGDRMKWVRERAELEFDPQGVLLGGFGTTQDITMRKQGEEALEESRRILEALMEYIPEGITIADAPDVSIRMVSKHGQMLTGRQPDEILNIPVEEHLEKWDIVHVDGMTPATNEELPLTRAVKSGEEVNNEEWVLRRPDGTTITILCNAGPILNNEGKILGGIIAWRDVTDRKEAEETLKASKDFLEIANRHTQMAPLLKDYAEAVKEYTGCQAVAIRILDEQGTIPYQAYAGFSPEFIACESPLSIHTDQCLCINVVKGATDPDLPCYTEGASCYINRFSHVLATTPPEQLGETRNVCHRFGYESVALIPIVFGENILGLIHLADCREHMVPRSLVERLERIGLQLGTAINRVRAEEERQRLIRELETERARLQAIIASAPEAIVVADANGHILLTNPAADRLYAHPEGCVPDAPSCALFQFCQADGTACVPGDQPLLRSAREGETHRNVEMVLAWPDGRHRDLLVNTAPITDQQGRGSGAVGLFQDITQRKRIEEKIRKLNAELSDRIREVSERTLQLEAANKELEAFSYSVSHDLRTPLRAIEGFARMLLEDQGEKLDGEGLRLLHVIRSNTRIMAELIDDLLALSRLGRQEIRAQEIDLGDLVTSVFGELRTQNPARQMELVLNPLPPAFGDRSLVNQVLVNLLGNAVKFTQSREKAIIKVDGWTEGKENIYLIKDNGVGFDMRYVEKIFGVFQRLHRREDFEGTGVGLAIVQRIISRHGGRVWATGKADQGAEFYFALPRKGEAS